MPARTHVADRWTDLRPSVVRPALTKPDMTSVELPNREKCVAMMTKNSPAHREDFTGAAETFKPRHYSNIVDLKQQ